MKEWQDIEARMVENLETADRLLKCWTNDFGEYQEHGLKQVMMIEVPNRFQFVEEEY